MKPLIEKFLGVAARITPCAQSAVLLFLRIMIGWTFFLTGKGKLANFDRTTHFFESLKIPAPAFHAGFVGGLEMVGGILLLIGLCSRLISVPLLFSMIVAYLTADREAFASISDFTAAAPFIYLCVTLVILVFGPGKFSLDALIARRFASTFSAGR
ncbi:MAG: DoxX family protein [Luteolibacter sp.]